MKAATERDYSERFVRSLVYIQEHLDEELSLEQVAGAAAFSTFHFHRIFRGLSGESLHGYVRRLRLERAAQRLKRADEPVTSVALDAGFETHEAFTRAFTGMFGESPSSFRAGFEPPRYPDLPPVDIKELPPAKILFLRHVGAYDQVGATWMRLMMWAGPRGLLGPGMRLLGIVHDDPDVTPPEKLRYDAAIVVRQQVEAEGEFGVMELPGGRYAVAVHKGPYDTLGATYQRVYGGWLPKSGEELRDAYPFEEYLNSPQNTRPEDLLTAIHLPLL